MKKFLAWLILLPIIVVLVILFVSHWEMVAFLVLFALFTGVICWAVRTVLENE